MNGLSAFIPELYAFAVVLVFFGLSLTQPNARRSHTLAWCLAGIGVAVCLASIGRSAGLFRQTYRIDLFSQVVKTLLFLGFFLATLLCRDLKGIDEKRHNEFYTLLGVGTLAMMMLVSSVHLITLYTTLELSSYSLYILVYLRKGPDKELESGLKYFIIGALSSAMMLFGFAIVYGTLHTAYLFEWRTVLPGKIGDPLLLTGLILSLSGFLFKLAVFPFHFWAPDAYEGSANQVAAFIATTSKVAAVAVVLRFVSALSGANDDPAPFLVVLSILSMTVGNLAALAQKDLKRMLAFSSIAHAGYALIGISGMNALGQASALFYVLGLFAMKYTCFMVVTVVSVDGRNVSLKDLAGLHQRAPILALALLLALFGLAGIPPTIGFSGKLMMFLSAMQAGRFYLVLIGMVNVVISLYYYLQILKAAYFLEPDQRAGKLPLTGSLRLVALILILIMLVGGLWPHFLMELAFKAVAGL